MALPFYAVAKRSICGMLLAFCFGALGISFTNGVGAYPDSGVTTAYYLENVENVIGYALE